MCLVKPRNLFHILLNFNEFKLKFELPQVVQATALVSMEDNILKFVLNISLLHKTMGFTGGSYGKNSTCNAGDLGLILGSGRSPGEGNGSPLQYSLLENPMDRGAWWAAVLRVAKSWTQLFFYFSLKALRLGKICLEAAWIKKERCQRIKTCKAERLRRYRAIVKERFLKK